eukprot:TRINITY_DN15_c0_g1_i4.p1 TRINITY_DN15_c0_g1~~TRINITY_DN15_c0_g1_i4.p1  ORF type:complete len:215 (-),score=57.05 TRINITY_DN15_c0_g1_i4:124-768(-)
MCIRDRYQRRVHGELEVKQISMKYILVQDQVPIPDNVKVSIRSRNVEVTGPLGKLTRDLSYLNFDGRIIKDPKTQKNVVRVKLWFVKRKQACLCRTICSQIQNLIRGVVTGYRYKMKQANRHFPIHTLLANDGKSLEIKNFLGEKIVRKITFLPGVTAYKKEETKDEITLIGTDINNVSLSCALINQSMTVGRKDMRKFLDGIYISERRLDMKE